MYIYAELVYIYTVYLIVSDKDCYVLVRYPLTEVLYIRVGHSSFKVSFSWLYIA
jgi:hypothetical protein